MQEQYQRNFETLSDEEAQYFANAIQTSVGLDLDHVENGAQLFKALGEMDHKTAVLCLGDDPTPIAIVILEKVIGKEIIRSEPKLNKASAIAKILASRPKVEGAAAPRLIKNDPRIIYDVIPNPKKAGSASYDRYNFYKEGMTVHEFLLAGGTTGDVKHDVSKGFIKLRDAE